MQQRWWLAMRPKTLWIGVTPVLVASAWALREGAFNPSAAVTCLLLALSAQVLSNLANDYYDWLRGSDRADRIGPVRVMQAGLVSAREMQLALAINASVCIACGAALAQIAGWPFIAVAAISAVSAWAYTGGPFPLAYNGLGELFVFIFFGWVAVGGTFYAHNLTLSPAIWIAGLGVGCLAAAVLVVNNLRDIPEDRRAGKMTLAARFGEGFARFEYVLLVTLGIGSAPLVGESWGLYLPLLAYIPALPLLRRVCNERPGPQLNEVLAGTSRLLLIYALLFAIGAQLP